MHLVRCLYEAYHDTQTLEHKALKLVYYFEFKVQLSFTIFPTERQGLS
jgi:hypothetical protein